MPDLAKVLRFPTRCTAEVVSFADALRIASEYLSKAAEGRTEEFKTKSLSSYDVLLAICKSLREMAETCPAVSADESSELYRWLTARSDLNAVFDEREYVLGETALIAAKASRLLGNLSDAERWLDRAEAAYRHTVNPAPCLAQIAFERLAIRFASGRFHDTLELLPSLKSSFAKLGMKVEHAKSRFLEAMALWAIGDREQHFRLLQCLDRDPMVQECPSLHGQVVVHIGNHEASVGAFDQAARTYERALPIVLKGNRPVALCELKWSIGEAYRAQGSLVKALESYRAAKSSYQELGLKTFVTHLSLVIAETLLAVNRDREAEWEILSALPTIEEAHLVPEGLAAVSLLRESVRRRNTDSNALRQLREYLQRK